MNTLRCTMAISTSFERAFVAAVARIECTHKPLTSLEIALWMYFAGLLHRGAPLYWGS